MRLSDFIRINKKRVINIGVLYFFMPVLISSFIGETIMAILYAKYFPLTNTLLVISEIIYVLLGAVSIFFITLGFLELSYLLVQDEELEDSNVIDYIQENKKTVLKLFIILLIFLFTWIGILLVCKNIENKYFIFGILILSSIILTYGIYIIISIILCKTLRFFGFRAKDNIRYKLIMFKDIKFIVILIINGVLTINLFYFLHTPIVNAISIILIIMTFIFLNIYITFKNID